MRSHCGDIEVAWGAWGRGDPLILIHGIGDDHRAWRKTVPWLALDRRVIAYDLRGHGQSTFGAGDGTLAQLSRDLIGLMDALELRTADVAGFSLGGTIVLRAAIDHPERVSRVLPIATSSRVGRAAAPWYEERAELAARGVAALQPVLREDTVQQLARVPQELEDHWLIRRESTADPAGFGNACRAMARLHAEPLDPELGRIRAPMLAIAAENDFLCPPRAAEIIVAAVPGSRMQVIPGSGHQVEIEQPEALSRLMLDFLRSPLP